MINRMLVVAALAVAVSGSAFAGGGLEPSPSITKRPAGSKRVEVPVVAPVILAAPADVRDNALFLGTFSSVEVEDINSLSDFDSEVFYVKYSPVVSGLSPVAQVIGGDDVWGVGGGVGYGFANKVKPYVTLDGVKAGGDDMNVGASLGLNVALPVGLALDLGVNTTEVEKIGKSGATTGAFMGLGYRW